LHVMHTAYPQQFGVVLLTGPQYVAVGARVMLVSAVSPVKASEGIATVDPQLTVKDVNIVEAENAKLPTVVTVGGRTNAVIPLALNA
jgi:hypothetical protein